MVWKFAIASVILFVLLAVILIRGAFTAEWRDWQTRYNALAVKKAEQALAAAKQSGNPKAISNAKLLVSAAESLTVGIDQITVTAFGGQQLDRCRTCHAGVSNPQMVGSDVPLVFQAHPYIPDVITAGLWRGSNGNGQEEYVEQVNGKPMTMDQIAALQRKLDAEAIAKGLPKPKVEPDPNPHPFSIFGCTSCHHGNGQALTTIAAHADARTLRDAEEHPNRWYYNVGDWTTGRFGNERKKQIFLAQYWTQPLLSKPFMIETACAACHPAGSSIGKNGSITFNGSLIRDPRKLKYIPQLATLNLGKELYYEYSCYGCHKIAGLSNGNVGPDLTQEGLQQSPAYIFAQLMNPKYNPLVAEVDPTLKSSFDCVMPNFWNITGKYRWNEKESVNQNLSVFDPDSQKDIKALAAFIYSQTGINHSIGPAASMAAITAWSTLKPISSNNITAAHGKKLFFSVGCSACHYVGNPYKIFSYTKPGDPFRHGNFVAPNLSVEGSVRSREWIFSQIENPTRFVPMCIMPQLPLTDYQRIALTRFLSSLKYPNGKAAAAQPQIFEDKSAYPNEPGRLAQLQQVRKLLYLPAGTAAKWVAEHSAKHAAPPKATLAAR